MKRKLAMMLLMTVVTLTAWAQTAITGTVVSAADGEPIPGATVKEKGASLGTVTGIDGKFTINVQAGKTLVFSYIGMQTKEMKAKKGMLVELESDEKMLDEVMVVAYGTTKKSSFTGSASEIKAEDIAAHVSTNVTNALANTTAGVQMTSSNGDPASESQTIRIRGIGSMYASNSPLIILDGMPYDGVMSNINPNDVESMTVLKDAAASAIYGARGANGVIIINTKKGKKQDAEIKFDAKWGSNSRAVPQYDVIDNPKQYYETAYQQLYNQYTYNGYSQAEAYKAAQAALLDANNGGLGVLVYTVPDGENLIGTNGKLNPNATLGYSDGEYYYQPDDWYNEAYHNSFRQEYNLSFSNATDRLNFYASAGYLNQKGIVNNSDYQRYTGRTNIDYQVKKWLKIGTQLSFTHADYEQPDYSTSSWASSGNMFYIVNNMGPIYPLYVRNADGSLKIGDNGGVVYDSNQTNQKRPNTVGNAVRDNEYDLSKTYRDMFNGNWSAIITPITGLTLTARIGVDSDNRRSNYLYSTFGNMSAYDGGAEAYNLRQFSVNTQYLANYKTDFGTDEKHNLDVLAGYEQYKYKYQVTDAYNTHLYDPTVGEVSNAYGPGSDKSVSSYTYNYMTEGFLARAQYDYMEKYVVSGSFRRDASSRFAPGHRWGNFYSVGAAWNMAKESFMSDVKWIDLLKVKASYGEQGNDNLGSYWPWTSTYSISYDSDAGTYSKNLSQLGNDELTWEKNKNFNVGVDFGMFKSRLSGSLEFFTRTTSDLLYYLSQPLSSGYGSVQKPINVGSIRNTGVELTLNGTPVKTKDFTWDVNVNLTHYKNKILKLDPSVAENGIKGSYYIYREGGSLYESYVYKYAGVYTSSNYCDETYDASKAGMAMYYYKEKDADGNETGNVLRTTEFSNASQFDCGDILPKLQGGLGMNFKLFNVDASFQLGFQLGGKFYDSQYQALMHTSDQSIGSAWHKDALNAWSETNQSSNIPRLDASYSVGQSAVDMYYTNSNYLSINNVTLGYTFPRTLLSKAGISALRIYLAGENLYVFSARKGLDPRYSFGIGSYTAGGGYASGNYSAMRTITAGLSLAF